MNKRIKVQPELSVIVPVFNEEDVLPLFVKRLKLVLDEKFSSYEVIFVDDGSTDRTYEILANLFWPQQTVIRFVHNSGHMSALEAGYRASSGKLVITMDGDLQHPPELIPEMVDVAISNQSDVVYAVRKDRSEEKWLKRFSAQSYYKILKAFSGIEIINSAADFRLISSKVVDVIKRLPKGNLVFRLLIPSLGFPHSEIEYIAEKRLAGETKYTFAKMTQLSVSSLVSYSTKPLTIAIQLGIATTAISFIGFIYAAISFFSGATQTGWASTISTILLLFGVLFIVLGVHGLYIGAILKNTMSRPSYIIRDSKFEDG
ncbi:glycosyltransferase family 2 protein [Aurantimicrobium minutum]|uniref:glycosyltransferase family 2 protein n=1 Tax=Aurantimicrobium minutum TaxID=708131 RepID=UPI00247562DC|nr:glycosyltransferase family 2 protein [Aurantimicrobium minutum]MDH6208294.1 glycosyltransferase involved in cell wall biosynthesis [Aurantimicrobium minutum]